MKLEVTIEYLGDAVLAYFMGTCPPVTVIRTARLKSVEKWSSKFFCKKTKSKEITYVIKPPLDLCCRARTAHARRALNAAIIFRAKPRTIKEAEKYLRRIKQAIEYGVLGYHTLGRSTNKLLITPFDLSATAQENHEIIVVRITKVRHTYVLTDMHSAAIDSNHLARALAEKYARRANSPDDVLLFLHNLLEDYSKRRRVYTGILALIPTDKETLALARLAYYFYRNPSKWKAYYNLPYYTKGEFVTGTIRRITNKARYDDKTIRESIHETVARLAKKVDEKDIVLMAKIAGKGITIKKASRQTGKSNTRTDKKRKALPPGKRVSRTGKVYYEYRRNRSDLKNKT